MAISSYLTRYLIQETSTISEAGTFDSSASGNGLAGTDNFGMYVNNNPQFESGLDYQVTRRQYGKPTNRSQDFTSQTLNPTTSYSFDVNTYVLDLYLRAFFQNGVSSSGGIYTANPFSTNTINTYISLLKYIEDNASIRIDGSIVNNISLTSGQNGTLVADTSFLGSRFTNNLTLAKSDTYFTFDDNPILLFQDGDFRWKDVNSDWDTAVDLDIMSFSLNMNNNAERRFGSNNDQYCYKYDLNSLDITGDMTIALNTFSKERLDHFFSKTASYIKLYWGTSNFTVDTAGDMMITLKLLESNYSISRDGEHFVTINFEMVDDKTDNIQIDWMV